VLVIVDVHLFGKDGPTCVDSSQCWKASIWWEQDDFPHILMRGTDNLNVFSKYPVPWCGHLAGWWFQTFFIVHNTWDNPSHWHPLTIFFKMVETTNQLQYQELMCAECQAELESGSPYVQTSVWRFFSIPVP
jgi:hypothetical protein